MLWFWSLSFCLTFSTYYDLIMFNVSIQNPNRTQQKHQLTNNHSFTKTEQVATLRIPHIYIQVGPLYSDDVVSRIATYSHKNQDSLIMI